MDWWPQKLDASVKVTAGFVFMHKSGCFEGDLAFDSSGGSGSGGEQFFNRFSERQDRHWSALVIEERFGVVDSQVGVDGSPQIVGGEGSFDRVLAEAIGGSDDLSGAHPAPSHDERHALRPVISAGLGDFGLCSYGRVDLRGATELAGHDEESSFVETALM